MAETKFMKKPSSGLDISEVILQQSAYAVNHPI